MWRQKWRKTELPSSKNRSSSAARKSSSSCMSSSDKSANKLTSSSTKISTSIGTESCSRRKKMTKMKFSHLRRSTLRNLSKTELRSRPNYPLFTSSLRNCSTCARFKSRWLNRKITSKLTKCKCALKNLRRTRDSSIWLMSTKRYLRPKRI